MLFLQQSAGSGEKSLTGDSLRASLWLWTCWGLWLYHILMSMHVARVFYCVATTFKQAIYVLPSPNRSLCKSFRHIKTPRLSPNGPEPLPSHSLSSLLGIGSQVSGLRSGRSLGFPQSLSKCYLPCAECPCEASPLPAKASLTGRLGIPSGFSGRRVRHVIYTL